MPNTTTLTFEVDRQPVEPVLIQFERDMAIWTLRPGADFSYQPRQVPGTPADLPSVTLGVRCSCGQLNLETLLDIIGFDDEDKMFGGTILRGTTTEHGRKPHEHLVDLSKSLKESYDRLLEKKRSEARAT